MADDRYFWQKPDEIMILKKGVFKLYVSLVTACDIFYEIAIAREHIFVRNSYPSPCASCGHIKTLSSQHVSFTYYY